MFTADLWIICGCYVAPVQAVVLKDLNAIKCIKAGAYLCRTDVYCKWNICGKHCYNYVLSYSVAEGLQN